MDTGVMTPVNPTLRIQKTVPFGKPKNYGKSENQCFKWVNQRTKSVMFNSLVTLPDVCCFGCVPFEWVYILLDSNTYYAIYVWEKQIINHP